MSRLNFCKLLIHAVHFFSSSGHCVLTCTNCFFESRTTYSDWVFKLFKQFFSVSTFFLSFFFMKHPRYQSQVIKSALSHHWLPVPTQSCKVKMSYGSLIFRKGKMKVTVQVTRLNSVPPQPNISHYWGPEALWETHCVLEHCKTSAESSAHLIMCSFSLCSFRMKNDREVTI